MRILALDVGERTIGLALSDPMGVLATPHSVYLRVGTKRDIEAIFLVAVEQRADALLVGIPISIDGTINDQARRVRRFYDALAVKASVPVLTYNERFSSVEADQRMIAAGMSMERQRSFRDAVAAAVFLQWYLDAQRSAGT